MKALRVISSLLAIHFAMLCIATKVFAYSDDVTHLVLTENATLNSTAGNYLNERLGMVNGTREILTATLYNGLDTTAETSTKSILDWLRYGSQMEDAPACRASNHFFDPLKPWAEAGLTDYKVSLGSLFIVPGWCDVVGGWPIAEIASNLTWATEYSAPGVITPLSGRPEFRRPFTWLGAGSFESAPPTP